MMRRAPRPAVAFVRHSHDYSLDLRREVEALVDAGVGCDVLYLGKRGSPRVQAIGGVTLYRLPGTKTRGGRIRYLLEYGWFMVVAGIVLGYLHLRHRYRAVQVNTMPDFLVYAAIVPKMLHTPLVVFMQEPTPELAATLGSGDATVRMLERAEQWALRFADHAITVTDKLRDRYVERGADANRISVVLNGPDPAHILVAGAGRAEPHEPGRFVALCHGTIEDRYGHDTLIDAVALAAPELPGLQLVVTGRGSATDAMLAQIADLGVSDRVRYEGWVSDERLAELLCDADVGIVAQKASAYSNLVHTNKMYDYWIAGLPVIASRLDATAADFDDDTIAYFEPGDPVDLARQLTALAASPERCAELAAAGRRAYDRVGWPVQKERYLDVYRTIAPGLFPTEPIGSSR